MGVWRYKAIPIDGPGDVRTGELSGDCAADVRASLRRARLQVLEIRQLRTYSIPLAKAFDHHLQVRRRDTKADLYDSLSTMLESGLPLTDSLDALAESSRHSLRSMLLQVRESVRAGEDLAEAMASQTSWFDPVELALVRAGQHAGDLSGVLRNLSSRHARSGELTQKLIGALAYPALVACVGLGVVIFLSTTTLPDLVRILEGASLKTPRLTVLVMGFGNAVYQFGVWLLGLGFVLVLSAFAGGSWLKRTGVRRPAWTGRCSPVVLRRIAIARFSKSLAELIGAGIPAVEAIRILTPTIGASALRMSLDEAVQRVEQGEHLADALDDPHWFDPEFRRLLTVGEDAGEVEQMLTRIGERYERRSRQLIDRLAAFIEPAVILILAALVGTVVIASVLPLLRLQEVL